MNNLLAFLLAPVLPVCLVFQLALPWDICSCIYVVWGT